ncbi:MAG: LamG domain-containing protein [Deltaproteobacteria bacterium]|jgi:hypothetical protein|nr:LamG domain-containing protein [Deltaproteobacteria bacterium]MBW2535296.1 LamG domain-containing protein [Deltaproteobacteria bacterium]
MDLGKTFGRAAQRGRRRGTGALGILLSSSLLGAAVVASEACHSGDFRQQPAATCPDQQCSSCPATGGSGGAGQGGDTGGGGGQGAGLVVDPTEGLVLHLRLDETTGAARDLVRDVTCPVRGAPTYRHGGIQGNSIGFAGDDGFDCGQLDPLQDFDELSVAAWVWTDEVPSSGMHEQSHAVSKTTDSVNDGGFALNLSAYRMVLTIDSDQGRQEVFANSELEAGRWTHVTGVYDGASLSMYLDGVLDATKSAAGIVPGGPSTLVVGNNNRTDGSPYGWNGRLDDVRVYERALHPDEVAEIAARQGWVLYLSQASGMLEVWAAHDDGSTPVRLTDNLVGPASNRNVWGPLASRDGRHFGIIVEKSPDSGVDEHYLYVASIDGSDFRDVVRIGAGQQGFAWDGFGRLVYVRQDPCEESLWRLDLNDASNPTLLRAGIRDDVNPVSNPGFPAANPSAPDDILVLGLKCGGPYVLQRVDGSTGGMTEFPGTVENARTRWFAAGDRFVFADVSSSNHDVIVYDPSTMTGVPVNNDANPQSSYLHLHPGNGGTRVYGPRWDPGPARHDLVSIDVATGALQTLVTDVDPRGVSWAIIPYDMDRDGDSLANGIDPTPDG